MFKDLGDSPILTLLLVAIRTEDIVNDVLHGERGGDLELPKATAMDVSPARFIDEYRAIFCTYYDFPPYLSSQMREALLKMCKCVCSGPNI